MTNNKHLVVPSLALLCIIALLIIGPIPQNQQYHHFADHRTMLGIPNFMNVITNLPFAFVGVLGIRVLMNLANGKLKHIGLTLFISFLLVTLGSGYYHLTPGNESLVYDRIPITIILMSFFTLFIFDLISQPNGYRAFFVLNIAGVTSVVYWHLTERAGSGDLRWYALVQFFPVIAIPLLLLLYKTTFNYWKELVPIILFFGLAKVAETFDGEIFKLLNHSISGHSLKHLFMIAAEYKMVVLMRRRIHHWV